MRLVKLVYPKFAPYICMAVQDLPSKFYARKGIRLDSRNPS